MVSPMWYMNNRLYSSMVQVEHCFHSDHDQHYVCYKTVCWILGWQEINNFLSSLQTFTSLQIYAVHYFFQLQQRMLILTMPSISVSFFKQNLDFKTNILNQWKINSLNRVLTYEYDYEVVKQEHCVRKLAHFKDNANQWNSLTLRIVDNYC